MRWSQQDNQVQVRLSRTVVVVSQYVQIQDVSGAIFAGFLLLKGVASSSIIHMFIFNTSSQSFTIIRSCYSSNIFIMAQPRNYFNDKSFSDVMIKFGRHEFHAHRVFLAGCSAQFEKEMVIDPVSLSCLLKLC